MKPYFEQKDRQKVTKVGWLRYKQVHNENCDCLLRWGIGGGLMVGLRYGDLVYYSNNWRAKQQHPASVGICFYKKTLSSRLES